MKPREVPRTSAVEDIQASFDAQFRVLEGFDRMARRWAALTSVPGPYGSSPAVKSALADLDFGQQKLTRAMFQPLPDSTLKQVLAPVAQITVQQSSFHSAMRWATVPQIEPVLAQTRAMQTVVESLRTGPLQQLVQQTQSHRRIVDLRVASMKPLVADRLFATPSDFGFAGLSRQLGGWATPDLSPFVRLADYGNQRWLNDIALQQPLFRDVFKEAAKSATLAYQEHLSTAASMRPLFETLTESITLFSRINQMWAESLQAEARRAAATGASWDDLLGAYPWGPDVIETDDWVLPGSPGTLEYPLLTAAGFKVITREALATAPYLAWIALCALIPHLGPAGRWADAKLDEYNLPLSLLPIVIWLSRQIRAGGNSASDAD